MREILFRGKREPDGRWLVGSLLVWPDGDNEICYADPDDSNELLKFVVSSNTVGQYTGLRDKNGKKIFEGDVVRYTEHRLGGEDVPVVDAVEFAEGAFAVRNYFLNHWLWTTANGNIKTEGIEVIGNIHDNPELLEANENV